MIGISDLNGGDSARLQEILLGRSEFASFKTNGLGRPLTVWVMSDDALARIEASMGARPSEPATPASVEQPRPVRAVPVSTGVREASAPVRPKETR